LSTAIGGNLPPLCAGRRVAGENTQRGNEFRFCSAKQPLLADWKLILIERLFVVPVTAAG
jgi:hypothetical protein